MHEVRRIADRATKAPPDTNRADELAYQARYARTPRKRTDLSPVATDAAIPDCGARGKRVVLDVRFYVSKKSHSLPSTQRIAASLPLIYPYSHAFSRPRPIGFHSSSRPYFSSILARAASIPSRISPGIGLSSSMTILRTYQTLSKNSSSASRISANVLGSSRKNSDSSDSSVNSSPKYSSSTSL